MPLGEDLDSNQRPPSSSSPQVRKKKSNKGTKRPQFDYEAVMEDMVDSDWLQYFNNEHTQKQYLEVQNYPNLQVLICCTTGVFS
jgi:hypothetical protein